MKRLSIDWYCPWVLTSAAASHATDQKQKHEENKTLGSERMKKNTSQWPDEKAAGWRAWVL